MGLVEIKEKVKRKMPKVIAIATTAVAFGALVVANHYKRLLEQSWENSIEIRPELIREVREDGAVLKWWRDEDGEHFSTIDKK